MIFQMPSVTTLIIVLVTVIVIVPLVGGLFLWVASRIVRIKGVTYKRCLLAYLAAYATASIAGTLLLLAFPGLARNSVFAVALVVGALAIHFIIVPLVLRTPSRKAVIAHCVAILLYAAFLSVVLIAPLLYARETARRTVCSSNLNQLAKAMWHYADDNSEWHPYDARGPLHSLALLYPHYVDDPSMFICPTAGKVGSVPFPEGTALAGLPCSYGYDHERRFRQMTPNTPIAADMPGNHGDRGFNVLYWDGHVAWEISPIAATPTRAWSQHLPDVPDNIFVCDTEHWSKLSDPFDADVYIGQVSPAEIPCPQCGKSIPYDTVVCPSCERRIRAGGF